MLKHHLATIAILLCSLPVAAGAAETSCPDQFAGGQAPVALNQRLLTRSAELCYSAFVIFHSGLTKTPLWAAERLTSDSLLAAKDIEREDEFYPETALPSDERAELFDYARSGFDRGHLAPAADMPDELAMQQSFSLANIIPQTPQSNRYLWKEIEGVVRSIAKSRGELYVITGPAFLGTTLEALGGRVAIPTHVFKAIYDPATGEAGAYITTNSDTPEWQRVSIDQLTAAINIDVFPALPAEIKSRAMALPDLAD